jgi:Histidine kinase
MHYSSSAPAGPRSWWPRSSAFLTIPPWVHALLWGLMLLSNGLYWVATQRLRALGWPVAAADIALTCGTYAALFYLNWRVIIPRYLARNGTARFVGVLTLTLGATFVLRTASITLLGLPRPRTTSVPAEVQRRLDQSPIFRVGFHYGNTLNQAGGGVAVTSLLVLLLSFYLRLTHDYQHEQHRREEEERHREALEKQHLAAELSLLKAQINPHFLFNTLNNIYSLTSEESVEAPAAVAVLQLAELMRYMLYESAADTVPLAKEVSHLQSFLSLQRLRLPGSGADSLQFAVPDTLPARYPIAPMLLLPLVENVFKHGDLTARPHVVDMALTLHDDQLTFSVRNGLRRGGRPQPAGPGGVGLANLRRRLQLLYPQRHQLHIQESATDYHVTLTLLVPAAG